MTMKSMAYAGRAVPSKHIASWDELRMAVRAEMKRRGIKIQDVAAAIGRGPAATRQHFGTPTPPPAALQAALRAWVSGDVPTSSRSYVTTTPGPAPPSASEPRLRMCAPSAKIPASADIVSPPITLEYLVFRLPDHDWRNQGGMLTAHAQIGWRLVCVYGGVAYMEREVRE